MMRVRPIRLAACAGRPGPSPRPRRRRTRSSRGRRTRGDLVGQHVASAVLRGLRPLGVGDRPPLALTASGVASRVEGVLDIVEAGGGGGLDRDVRHHPTLGPGSDTGKGLRVRVGCTTAGMPCAAAGIPGNTPVTDAAPGVSPMIPAMVRAGGGLVSPRSRGVRGSGRIVELSGLRLGLRDVAQLGSALDWGSRGRRFKSCHPDRKVPGT